MDITEIKTALKKLEETSTKRNFKQSIELIINLKELNIKNNDNQIDLFIPLHNSPGKNIKVCALVGPELKEDASKICDHMIFVNDFKNYTDKKEIKKLAESYDYFIAQATVMAKIATTFGKVFGPRGKMPNPKAGLIVPPKFNLQPLVDRLKKTVRAKAKTHLSVQVIVGKETQNVEEVADNILTIYNAVLHALPREKNNIKSSSIKYTMSKPVEI